MKNMLISILTALAVLMPLPASATTADEVRVMLRCRDNGTSVIRVVYENNSSKTQYPEVWWAYEQTGGGWSQMEIPAHMKYRTIIVLPSGRGVEWLNVYPNGDYDNVMFEAGKINYFNCKTTEKDTK